MSLPLASKTNKKWPKIAKTKGCLKNVDIRLPRSKGYELM